MNAREIVTAVSQQAKMSTALAADVSGVVGAIVKVRTANVQQAEAMAGLSDTLLALRAMDGESTAKPNETA